MVKKEEKIKLLVVEDEKIDQERYKRFIKKQKLSPLDDLKTTNASSARTHTSLALFIPNSPLYRQG